MSDDLELTGRRALVTGGTQGIGQALVSRSPRSRGESSHQRALKPSAADDSHFCNTVAWPPRLHPGITQEVACNENQRGPKATP